MTLSNDASPATGPAHVAAWLHQSDLRNEADLSCDEDLLRSTSVHAGDVDVGHLDTAEWVRVQRRARPDLTLAVLHDGRGVAGVGPAGDGTVDHAATAPADDAGVAWWEHLVPVVECMRGGTGRFIGDTTPTSLASLRGWAGQYLHDADVPAAAAADAVLLVDELASNVQEHAPGWLTVDLGIGPGHVLVVVSDPHPTRIPVLAVAPPDQPHGRGLVLVSAMSRRWGLVVGASSKAVWAEVPCAVDGAVRPGVDGSAGAAGSAGAVGSAGAGGAMVESAAFPVDTGVAADGAVV